MIFKPQRSLLGLALSSLFLAGCATVPPERHVDASHNPAYSVGQAAQIVDGQVNGAQQSASRNSASAASPSSLESKGPSQSAAPVEPDLIRRIRAGFAMPELPDSVVNPHIRRFTAKPEYLERVFARGGPYLFHIVEEIEARGMPMELALLPIVESAFNPQATSSAKAAGLWQFIPSTGRVFDLNQNWWTDERRDVIESTRAALEYLDKIYHLQGQDWFLALASYNWGEGAVGRAIRANKAHGRGTDYLSLPMPKETRNYVPKLIALRNILRDPARYGVTLPEVPNKPFFAVIDKGQSIDLELAAELAGLSLEEFQQLNPHLRRPVIAVSQSNRIVLPIDSVPTYNDNLQAHIASGQPLVTWQPHTLKKGDSLASLARQFGTTAERLAKANGITSAKKTLMPGSSLLVPVLSPRESAELEQALAKFPGARTVESVTLPAKIYRVRKKDTLAKIARRFGVSTTSLKQLNKLKGEVKVGMRLVIRPAERRTLVTDAQGRRVYR